ncbi:hypothetical protein FGG08_002715 [Glutinoglossum americanum]|uniref:Zn(2)-C6 fungal-type domain-containing protein n=1 Tax=Glutinoglossum americanum TaxID=1670608 RepID=A0A9P8I499_9PEZI|nr:hypothetical protein FGG08_002715 [Glutinoglossum americanum]
MEVPGFPIPPGQGGDNDNHRPLPSREERIRRRNRTITSCLECRKRKLRCNKQHPCTHCLHHGRNCLYISAALDPRTQSRLAEIKEEWGSIERRLERDIARAGQNPQRDDPLPGSAKRDVLPEAGEEELEETPMAVLDAAYEDDADDEFFDLGIQMGRMRCWNCHATHSLNKTLNDSRNDRRSQAEKSATPELAPPSAASIYELLMPGSTYIAPGDNRNAPNYFFGGFDPNTPFMAYMTPRPTADRLKRQYFDCVHPLAMLVHRPTFENQYERFWNSIAFGAEPPYSLQALYFAMMFSSAVSLNDEVIFREYGRTKQSVVNDFRMNTEAALSKAGFIRTTKLETLQAFVMYLIPLCRDEISRAHSALTATAIRIAECMGLHRDGKFFGLTPVDIHVRRLVWYQLCFLDLRTCESQGPRPIIRKEDFDTKFPLNLDDADFTRGDPPLSVERWTDTTFSLIRFECNEMVRIIWVDRPRLEKKEVSLTAVLTTIETFKYRMEKKYSNILRNDIPIQKAAKHVMIVLICRMYVMVLHRYLNSGQRGLQDRIRQMTITNALCQIENAIALENDPDLSPWVWYAGAWQQWQTALLMLTDIWGHPNRPEADRIWACLDYVFGGDPHTPRDEKARRIMMELRDKAGKLRSARKLKLPVVMTGQRARLRMTTPVSPGSGVDPKGSTYNSPQLTPKDPSMSPGNSPGPAGSPGGPPVKEELMPIEIDWEEFDKICPESSTSIFEPVDLSIWGMPSQQQQAQDRNG